MCCGDVGAKPPCARIDPAGSASRDGGAISPVIPAGSATVGVARRRPQDGFVHRQAHRARDCSAWSAGSERILSKRRGPRSTTRRPPGAPVRCGAGEGLQRTTPSLIPPDAKPPTWPNEAREASGRLLSASCGGFDGANPEAVRIPPQIRNHRLAGGAASNPQATVALPSSS